MQKTEKWIVKREKNLTTSRYGNWLPSNLIKISKFLHDNKKILEGVHENYLFNGNLWFRGDFKYKNKKLTGYVDFFWENGQLETKRVYKNGLLNGPYERFYENGQLETKRVYKNGLLNGPYERFYENGQLETKRVYKNGLLIEELESFFKNGRICYKGNDLNFSDNRVSVYCWVCGCCDARLDHENNLEPEEYYKHEFIHDNPGRIISYIYPHEEKHISGVHECFYDSSHYYKKVHTRFSFINGKKHGFEESYTYKGNLLERLIWNMGVLLSEEEFFYDTGGLAKYSLFYKNGNLKKSVKSNLYLRQRNITWVDEEFSKCDFDKAEPINLFNKENKASVSKTITHDNGKISESIFYTKNYSYLYQSTYFRSGNLRSQLEISKGKMHYYEFYASGENKLKLLLDLNEKDLDLTKVKTKLMHWNKGHTPKDWIHKFL
jgi:antitoxin component YwqK of YwqJK toxin-antitoxin module